ncbi:hypothetical protein Ari01nite_33540 [Paractinoplanes rishiriensis]|uniref:Uncharacterized protein n=1 Tax=Paractinoplanes rishiriensis TaxID=1050105 RepID=A0A919MUZ8_9ACTN|nr:hypothetical protein Ari01nite_33540 [Actinoplanes rishiriensis]
MGRPHHELHERPDQQPDQFVAPAGLSSATPPAHSRRRASPPADTVRSAEDAVEETSQAGRSTADGGTGGTPAGSSAPPPQTDPLVTYQTGQPNGTPTGPPTRVRPEDDAPTQRSIELENSGANVLADRGWRVQQNPTPDEVARARQESGDTGSPQSNPDYLL